MRKSAKAVQAALDAAGLACEVVELPASTRSAREAAEAIGCSVAQIDKSIVFRGAESGEAVLVVASGANRIDAAKVAAHAGEALAKAGGDFVRERTGFAIGGVPPCGHAHPQRIFIDRDLLAFDDVWAAAGTPHAVFRLRPSELEALTGGRVIEVS